jgi:hypothetical protein
VYKTHFSIVYNDLLFIAAFSSRVKKYDGDRLLDSSLVANVVSNERKLQISFDRNCKLISVDGVNYEFDSVLFYYFFSKIPAYYYEYIRTTMLECNQYLPLRNTFALFLVSFDFWAFNYSLSISPRYFEGIRGIQ